jgi:hypothetical protein
MKVSLLHIRERERERERESKNRAKSILTFIKNMIPQEKKPVKVSGPKVTF